MMKRKIIGLFVIFSAVLLLAGCESTNNSQVNNQNANEVAVPENNKPEEQKVEQASENTNTENNNNLTQTGDEPEEATIQTVDTNNLSSADNISQEIKSEVKNEATKYYKVIKVVDGDTIAVNIDGKSETIRMIGINTPETVDPRKPVECFGVEASNKAKELLTGKLVILEADPSQDERDKYGRLLRYIRTESGLFYNLEIIRQGYAYEYTYDTPYKYQSQFNEAENYARTNKIGLWADGACGEKNIDSPATISPAPVITPAEPVKTPETKAQCECSSNKYNCTDFKTQAEAQALFECCGGTGHDIHKLDSDKDGKVCESLP